LCNVFALCWIPVLIVLVCMPPALPIAVESMNYTSPILVGIVVIIVGGYFVFGKHFEGPNIDWDMLNAGNRLEHEMKTSSG
jgi:choline transport protein